MHPSNQEFMTPPRDRNLRRSAGNATGFRPLIRSQSLISRLASDGSWIEVASQPSSSSLSSVAPDEVVTTGLRVTQSGNPRRRQRLRRSTGNGAMPRSESSGGSSQEEYDESESGSDPAMTGSPLGYQTHFLDDEVDEHEGNDNAGLTPEAAASSDGDDDTALGFAESSPVFTPQPNAFSHPPSSTRLSRPISRHTTDSYFPSSAPSLPQDSSSATASTPPTSTSSMPSRVHARARSHTPYTLLQPSHTVPVDHDAALRASLSTLLSCAAAARGLPKRDVHELSRTPSRPPLQRVEPGSFRLIPESQLDQEAFTTSPESSHPAAFIPRAVSPASSSRHSGKRAARSPTREKGREKRTKRRATASPADAAAAATVLSPTLLTWVVGAGVMVLFSALSFSAGYALGREVGRVEAGNLGVGGMELGLDADGGMGFLERSTAGLRRRVWGWSNASGLIRA